MKISEYELYNYALTILDIDTKKGIAKWREHRGSKARKGEIAGSKTSNGYVRITLRINKILYEVSLHRLIFYKHNNYLPKQIDHINRKKNDNRILNLRESCPTRNQWNKETPSNNSSGFRGVRYIDRNNKYSVSIQKNKNRINVGTFSNLEDAIFARKIAEKVLYKEYRVK